MKWKVTLNKSYSLSDLKSNSLFSKDEGKRTLSCSADHTEWSSPPLCQGTCCLLTFLVQQYFTNINSRPTLVTNCSVQALTNQLQEEMIVNGLGAPNLFSQIRKIQDYLPHGYNFQFTCSHGHRMIGNSSFSKNVRLNLSCRIGAGEGRISCENKEWTRNTWCEGTHSVNIAILRVH